MTDGFPIVRSRQMKMEYPSLSESHKVSPCHAVRSRNLSMRTQPWNHFAIDRSSIANESLEESKTSHMKWSVWLTPDFGILHSQKYWLWFKHKGTVISLWVKWWIQAKSIKQHFQRSHPISKCTEKNVIHQLHLDAVMIYDNIRRRGCFELSYTGYLMRQKPEETLKKRFKEYSTSITSIHIKLICKLCVF